MSFAIQSKLCDDVLGVILSFKGHKTKHHKQFEKCLKKITWLKQAYIRGEKRRGYKFEPFQIMTMYWCFRHSKAGDTIPYY